MADIAHITSRRSVLSALAAIPSLGAPVLAFTAIAAPPALAMACTDAVALRTYIDTTAGAESWSDEELTEQCDTIREAIARAIAEPSSGLSDIQAKARLALDQITADEGSEDDDDIALAATVLREIIGFTGVVA